MNSAHGLPEQEFQTSKYSAHGLRVAVLGAILLSWVAGLEAASPRLTLITPRGVQRGGEHVITLRGTNLGDAQEVLFYESTGFKVTKLEPNGNTCAVTLQVSPDCRLGEHVLQVRTATGISDFRTLFVEALPEVKEKEPNNEFDAAQAITVNSTVEGIVQAEDVDYFVIEAKKGQRISAEVVGIRLGTTLFDPYVAILDSRRFELSAHDDTAFALQDGYASVIAPEDGKYVIEVRESAYGGNGNCRYRLHVGNFPRPSAVYPAGGQIGAETEVKFLGLPGGELTQKVQAPKEAVKEYGVFAKDAGGIAPTPNAFRLFPHGNAFEAEPNNSRNDATVVSLPNAFNGIIQSDADVDYFKFQAKKGQVFDVECYARRIRSGLDPIMHIYGATGGALVGNDDSRGPDSYIRFTVPADGEYVVRVTDHLRKGRPDYVYRIEFTPVAPQLSLSIPRTERYGQYRQQIYVAKGNRFGTLINASRANFSGSLVLENSNLPAGIKVHSEPMASNLSSMPVVFEATADATLSGKLVDFTARHAEKPEIRGGFANSADMVYGAPGQSVYRRKDVDRLPIAVVDELPFKIQIVEPQVPLVRNGSMKLKVVAERKEGFTAAIRVEFPFRPPGLSAASAVTIPEGKSEVLYPLNASSSAQLGTWKVFALGSANVGGTAWASSQLAKLDIAEAYATFAIQRTACEQGQPAQILCKITHVTPFEGEATARLLGLPPKVTTQEMKFTKDTAELVFDLTTDATSPVGKHNLLCQLQIPKSGETMVSRGGGVQLQIDKPLPAPVVAKPAPKPTQPKVAEAKPKPAPPMAKPPKPLSRLEKLRLAAQQRKEAKKQQATEGSE